MYYFGSFKCKLIERAIVKENHGLAMNILNICTRLAGN